jgi:hypothetical protein
MMRCLKWILTSLVLSLVAFGPGHAGAALSSLPAATTFFRSSESSFPSGQSNRIQLERQLVRTEQEFSYQVSWNQKNYTLKAEDLLRDLQLSALTQLKENSQLLDDTRSNARGVAELSKGANVELLSTRQHWARVKSAKGTGWLPLHRLEARNDDAGLFVPLIDTFLRERPKNSGPVKTTIPRRTRLKALEILAEGWIRVSHNGQSGYVDLHHVASRADFATWAWRKNKGWLTVSHREGAKVKMRSGEVILLNDLVGYSPNPHRGLVLQNETKTSPPLRAQVEIKKIQATVWGVSDLDAHGEVWWKKEFLLVEDDRIEQGTLTTEELLKRSVFSYALTGTKKIEGLVSAQGIWKTLDGLKWTRISMFGDQNLPVAIHPDGWWLVGSQGSRDKGASFESFIRWDTLAQTIEFKLGRPPRYLKLQKVESRPGSKVQITVDTGIKRLSLKGSLLGNTWKITR